MSEFLDYERPDAEPTRISKLAIASLYSSLLSCPCVSGLAFYGLARQHWIRFSSVKDLVLAGLVFSPSLAATAHIRIRRSRGRLNGKEYIYFAYAFSVLWVLSVGLILLVLLGVPAIGPRN